MNAKLKSILFGGRGGGDVLADVGLGLLRIGAGLYLALGHGMSKLYSNGHFGPDQKSIGFTASLGFPMPAFFAWCSTLAESVVALMLACGLFTRIAAAILVFNMGVAAFLALKDAPWVSMTPPSKETAMMYFIAFLPFIFTGGGRFSADAMIRSGSRDPNTA